VRESIDQTAPENSIDIVTNEKVNQREISLMFFPLHLSLYMLHTYSRTF
jgi:hypothetical protein